VASPASVAAPSTWLEKWLALPYIGSPSLIAALTTFDSNVSSPSSSQKGNAVVVDVDPQVLCVDRVDLNTGMECEGRRRKGGEEERMEGVMDGGKEERMKSQREGDSDGERDGKNDPSSYSSTPNASESAPTHFYPEGASADPADGNVDTNTNSDTDTTLCDCSSVASEGTASTSTLNTWVWTNDSKQPLELKTEIYVTE
jgi:hypothetical protein